MDYIQHTISNRSLEKYRKRMNSERRKMIFHFSLFPFPFSLKKNFSLFTFLFSLKRTFSLKKNFSLFTFSFSLKRSFSLKKNFSLFPFLFSLKRSFSLKKNFSLFPFLFSLKRSFSLKKNFSLFTFHFSLKRIFSLLAFSQTSPGTATENYVYSKTCLDADCVKKAETVQYFDGLGRPKQVVNVKASPTGKDVVTPIEYDGFGRQVKDYLPIPQTGTQNGGIYTNPLSNATTSYGAEKIYAEKVLENSPLDRILQQKQVGNDWNTKPINFGYDANAANEVKKYATITTWSNNATVSTLTQSAYYPANQLYKNTVTDEDGNVSIEFKNGEGQTLLVRKNDGTQNVDTYYVYNEYNQLAFVLPPLASAKATLTTTDLDNLCYQYRYDGRNRLVEKKIPGKGWEYLVYDQQDRLVATKDAVNQWLFTKYDQFGRVLYTGIANLGTSRITVQNALNNLAGTAASNNETRHTSGFNNSNMQLYYTNTAYPTTITKILSVNYYDTYPTGTPAIPTTILGQNVLTQDAQNSNISTKTLPTASYVKNIEDDNWTQTYTWYDTKGRAIGSHSINYLGGYTKTESLLDFAGVVQQTKTYHKRLTSDTEKLITETFEYDPQNRLRKHYHQVDSQPQELLADNTYNELSQLSNKKVGNNLQSIDYSYNIRGWMTKINNPSNLGTDLFGYEIKYQNPTNTTVSSAKYNGNIAEVDWRTSNDGVLRRYGYQYDALNRLRKGIYQEPNASIPQNNFYNEELTYDVNGNIQTLTRNTKNLVNLAEQIDNLQYSYIGNQLDTVTDSSQNYAGYPDSSGNPMLYDSNGNMTSQKDKGIVNINYNHLNLPNTLTFNENFVVKFGKSTTQTIYNVNTQYLYRADGVKLKKMYSSKGQLTGDETYSIKRNFTEYLDGFQYETFQYSGATIVPNPVQVLKFVPTAEGYYNFENNTYIYNYVDHLGNVRLSYFRNGSNSAEVLEENNYYPFGLKHDGYNMLAGNPAFRYGYNNKELQIDTGWSDYGARNYMSDIGRWGVIDNYSEKGYDRTNYGYVSNNPIMLIDPDGNWEDNFEIDEQGNITKKLDTQDNFDRLYKKGSLNENGTAKTGLKEGTDYVQVNKSKEEDGTIISDLQTKNNDGDSYGTTTNSADARKIFQFAADNSRVEWTIGGFKTGKNENTFLVGTSHIANEVTAPWKFGEKRLNYDNLFYAGHTHPFTKAMQPHDKILSKPDIYNFIYYTGSGSKYRENYFVPFDVWVNKSGVKVVTPKSSARQIKLPNLIP